MISDTLAEAISEIEAYQTSMPGVYEGMRGEIEATLVAMTRLMVRLDSPPGEEPERWLEQMTRAARNDPGDLRERMRDRIYVAKRDMMVAAVGADHPSAIDLTLVEEAARRRVTLDPGVVAGLEIGR